MESLEKEVKQRIEAGESINLIEENLINQGYLEQDVTNAVSRVSKGIQTDKKNKHSSATKHLFVKELFDRAGYGFGSQQFVNILFFQTGASYFIIAIINGLKAILSSTCSSYLKEFSKENNVSNRVIGISGIVFGFSFLIMAISMYFKMVWLFAVAILLGAIGVVAYGELYHRFMKNIFKGEKRGLIDKIYRYGLLITVGSMILGAYILEKLKIVNISIPFFGNIKLVGYFIAFEIATILFVLSGYILAIMHEEGPFSKIKELFVFFSKYIKNVRDESRPLFKNRLIVSLMAATTIIGLVQILGHSFYGIFIFQNFQDIGFKGYLNVAVIFAISVIASLVTPLITKENAKIYGKFPMLIFGTTLMAIMPLTFFYNPNLISVGMGTVLGVIGSAINGIAQGLLAVELIPKDIRKSYFAMSSMLPVIPYILTIPIGAYIVQTRGLGTLFLVLGLMLLLLVVPIYFVVMLIHEKNGIKYGT